MLTDAFKVLVFVSLKVFWLKKFIPRNQIKPLTSLPLMSSSWSLQGRGSCPSCELLSN